MKKNSGFNAIQKCRPLYVMVLTIGLVACSGGGGGDGGSGSGNGPNPVNYTGATTQAAVTNPNGDDLSAGAARGAGAGSSTSLVGVSAEIDSPVKLRSAAASRALKRALGRMDYSAQSANQLAGAMVSDSGTLSGTCGGSAAYDLTVDDVTGNFNGTVNYSGYCDDADVLTGSASFSGNIDVNTIEFNSIYLSTPAMRITSGGDTFIVTGSFSFTNITAGSESLLMTLNIGDASGTVFRVENFQCMAFYDSPMLGTDGIRILSGRFYHPVHGYVDVVTTSDFLINSDYPYSGVLVVTGSNGSKAELTANSDAQTFAVRVDADGIGGYDGPAATYRWDAI